MAIEPILADGAILDKGRAMFLVSKCQVASAASYDPVKKAEGRSRVETQLHLQEWRI